MSAVDRRYAQALMDLVGSGKADAGVLTRELADFSQMMRTSTPLRGILQSPAVQRTTKLGLIDALVKRTGATRLTRNFLAVLADRGRTGALDSIRREFDQLWLARQGILRAEVISARRLGSDERGNIEKSLSFATGRRVQASYREDELLIGGFVAKVGDTVYDGSIRGHLDRLHATLAG